MNQTTSIIEFSNDQLIYFSLTFTKLLLCKTINKICGLNFEPIRKLTMNWISPTFVCMNSNEIFTKGPTFILIRRELTSKLDIKAYRLLKLIHLNYLNLFKMNNASETSHYCVHKKYRVCVLRYIIYIQYMYILALRKSCMSYNKTNISKLTTLGLTVYKQYCCSGLLKVLLTLLQYSRYSSNLYLGIL